MANVCTTNRRTRTGYCQLTDMTLDELLLDDNFRQWVLHPTAQLNQQWATRFSNGSAEDREAFRQASSVLLNLPPEEILSDTEVAQLWGAIKQQQLTVELPTASPVRQIGWKTNWYRIAAVLALIVLLGGLGRQLYKKRTIAVQTSFGHHQQIILPDGSQVTLNGNSTLSYPANWKELANRDVSLEGEAYFKVNKQRINNQPVKFTVHSADLNIEVVGTQFNVRNRRGDVDVVLDEGEVRISRLVAATEQPALVMKPGDIIKFSKNREIIRQQKVAHPNQYSAWTTNALIFNETPLSEIAQTLQDTYGLTVTFADDSLARLTFTGNMPASDPELVLSTLTKAFDLQLMRPEANKIIFSSN